MKMGKIILSLQNDVDLNLLDLIRGQVDVALKILMENHKTKAQYEKSFKSALQAVQKIKTLLNCSPETIKEKSPEKLDTGKIVRQAPEFEPIPKVAKTNEDTILGTAKKISVDARSPAQKALANPLIVQKMMETVIPRTLKSCRRVCKLWENEATKQLLTPRHAQFLEVKLQWSENHGEYKHICLGTLQAFIDFCLKKSRQFPCVQYNFIGGNLSSPAFLNFFTKFGASVKFLQLNPSIHYEDESSLAVKNLGMVLFKLAPNLESLTLSSMDWTRGLEIPTVFTDVKAGRKTRSGGVKPQKIQKKEDPPKLLNLKRVTLPLKRNIFPNSDSEMNRAVLGLLKAAPNLEQVTDRSLYFTREIVTAGKFGLIKFLWFDLEYVGYEERYLYFSEQGPQLEAIEFSRAKSLFSGGGVQNSLTAILRSSQETLTTVRAINRFDFNEYRISPLKNVKSLYLQSRTTCWYTAVVPEGQKLVNYFPNLAAITCEDPNILEDPSNASNFVINLFILWMIPSAKLISVAESQYPNLKLISLTVGDNRAAKLPDAIKAICSSFPQLEILRIHMTVTDFGWSGFSEMDAAFTGLPLLTCQDSIEIQRERPDDKVLKGLMTNGQPSIRDLTRLKKLEICMEQRNPNHRVHRLCTRISDLYAFDLMKRSQGLEVVEVVRHQM